MEDATASASWHAMTHDEVCRRLGTDATAGLDPADVARRLAASGPNALPESSRRSMLAVFVRQFASPLIYILFIAAGIALAVGNHGDAGVILVVVVINAIIGAFQEGRAEHSMETDGACRHGDASLRIE